MKKCPTEQKTKILVVDDSAFMRQYLIGYLHEGGYFSIFEAGNGRIALESFSKNKPDIVLLDLIMPVEDGVETLKKLVGQGAKVIVISAIGQKQMIERILKMGAKGYFIKPFFSTKEIAEKIEEAVNSK